MAPGAALLLNKVIGRMRRISIAKSTPTSTTAPPSPTPPSNPSKSSGNQPGLRKCDRMNSKKLGSSANHKRWNGRPKKWRGEGGSRKRGITRIGTPPTTLDMSHPTQPTTIPSIREPADRQPRIKGQAAWDSESQCHYSPVPSLSSWQKRHSATTTKTRTKEKDNALFINNRHLIQQPICKMIKQGKPCLRAEEKKAKKLIKQGKIGLREEEKQVKKLIRNWRVE